MSRTPSGSLPTGKGSLRKILIAGSTVALIAGIGLPGAANADVTGSMSASETTVAASSKVAAKRPAATRNGGFIVRVGVEQPGENVNVSVRLKSKKKGVRVFLDREQVGGDKTIGRKTSRKKGRVNFSIPARYVSTTPTAFTVKAEGVKSSTFVVRVSPPQSGIVGAVPGRIGGLRGVPYDDMAAMRWNPRADATEGYLLQWQQDGDGDRWNSITTDKVQYDVTNLSNGIDYNFRVAGVNPDGVGPWSGTVKITPKFNPPAEVENLTATPVDSSVVLRWDRSTLASDYTVQATCEENVNFDDSVCFVDRRTTTGSSMTWGGLENNLVYLFGVTPTGVDGAGERATITAEPKPRPATPKNFNVEPGNRSVYLSWSAVEGATEYRAYYKPDGGVAAWGAWTTNTFTSVTGLVNGQPYTIGVQTRNPYGAIFGPSDTGIAPTADAPGAIEAVGAVPGDSAVTLSWLPVANADDYAVHYRAVGTTTGLNDPVPFLDSNPNDDYITMTIPALDNGVEYEFFVWAENLYGRGPADTVTAAPNGSAAVEAGEMQVAVAPGIPPSVRLTPRDSQIRATWGASTDSPDGYLVYYSTNSQDWTFDDTYAPNRRSATLMNLTNGVNYWVQVLAYNEDGQSAPAVAGPAMPLPAPEPVDNFRGYASNEAVQLSWAPDDFTNTYRIRYQDATGAWSSTTTVDAPATTYRVENLTNDVEYTFEIRPVNTTGIGPAVTTGPIVPSSQVPGVVTDATGEAGDAQVTLTWTPPADATGYKVITQLADSGDTISVDLPNVSTVPGDGAGKITHTVVNLENGTPYNFYIFSVNQYGWSGPAAVGPLTPQDVIVAPDAPTIIAVTPYSSSVEVAYTLGSPGSADFNYLEYSTDGGASWNRAATYDSPLNIAGLDNGATYQISLRITNMDDATSQPSNTADATPIAAPAKPSLGDVQAGDKTIVINYDAPSTAAAPVQKVFYTINNGDTWTQADDTTSPITVTGLENGKTYKVLVRASNTTGNADSDMKEATPETTILDPFPPAVDSVSPKPGDVSGIITVNYTLKEDAERPLGTVTYTVTDGTAPDPLASGTLPSTPGAGTVDITISETNWGANLTVTVTAENSTGNPVSGTGQGVAIGVPAKPSLTVTPGDDTATVTYSAPSSAARPVDSVTYVLDGGAAQTATSNPFTITGLTDDTHTIYITSINTVNSTNSDTTTFRPVPAPTAPAAPTLTAATKTGQTTGAISWKLNSNGGATINSVQYNLNGGSWVTIPNSAEGGTTTFSISGLTADTTYTVTVRAQNSVGYSPASNAMSFKTDPVPPPPPPVKNPPLQPTCTWTGVDVNSVTVKCDRNVNGPAPTGFNIGGVNVTGSTTGTATITGLTPDTLKTVPAYAYNGDGNSPTASVQTATNPVAPTITMGTITQPGGPGTNRCAPLTWNATAASGQYALMVNNSWWGLGPSINGTSWNWCDAVPTSTYQFKVAGVNQLTKNATWLTVKLGPTSANPATLGPVPAVPTVTAKGIGTTQAEGGQITVTASSPGATSGAIFRDGAFAQWNTLSVTDKGLLLNNTERYKAYACNANGCSTWSGWTSAKTSPAVPVWDVKRNVGVDPKTKIDFTTTGIAGTGGKSFRIKWCSQTQYGTNCDPFSQGDSTGWITDTGPVTRTIGGLTPGTGYRFGIVIASDTSGGNPITKSNVQRASTG